MPPSSARPASVCLRVVLDEVALQPAIQSWFFLRLGDERLPAMLPAEPSLTDVPEAAGAPQGGRAPRRVPVTGEEEESR